VSAVDVELRGLLWRRSLGQAARVAGAGYLGWLAVLLALRGSGALAVDGRAPSWRQWDAIWYERIAEVGYRHAAELSGQSTAFFPLYPLAVRGVDAALPGGATVAAVAVSGAAYLGALAVLHRLCAEEFDAVVARRALWLVAAFPTAFFLAVGYNMALGLLLTVSAVYALRRQQWWAAGLFGGLATATRSSAVLLLVAFGYEYARRIGWRPSPPLLAGALIPAGLIGYAAYLWTAFGDPLAFAAAQRSWGRHPDWPWSGPAAAVSAVLDARTLFVLRVHNAIDLAAVALALGLLLTAVRRPAVLRPDQRVFAVFGLAMWLLIVCFPSANPSLPVLTSAGRLTLELFPVFAVLALLLARPAPRLLFLGVATTLQVGLYTLYVLGLWAG